jgi:hypothetical protein
VVRTRTAERLDDGYTGLRAFRWPGIDLVGQVKGTWFATGQRIVEPAAFSPGLTVPSRGILAGPTARDRWTSNQPCVLDEGGSSAALKP